MIIGADMRNAIKLIDGAVIGVVGGGPAGSFFSHFILKQARKRGVPIKVCILDGKDFLITGPRGCNLCAGVVSEPLCNLLEEEEIVVPERCIQKRISGYYIHTEQSSFKLLNIHGRKEITTVYRGNGPRNIESKGVISFDDYMVQHVLNEGAEIIRARVREVKRIPGSGKFLITYGEKDARSEIVVDLLVAATGLNTNFLNVLTQLGFGYHPPKSLICCLSEIPVDNLDNEYLSEFIHTFFLRIPSVKLAAIIPKQGYLTVSMITRKDSCRENLEQFLAHPIVENLVSESSLPLSPACFCHSRMSIGPAKKPFADRLVVVGDAGMTRYYKNGLDSAFLTAKMAASTAFDRGISNDDFKEGFYKPGMALIANDNRFGSILFGLDSRLSRWRGFNSAKARLAQRQQSQIGIATQEILWNMLTGNQSYRQIFKQVFSPKMMLGILAEWVKTLLGMTTKP
ncbi:MAG: hypothetical protein CO189_03615 [candidate division Zixibacteria bacterium CG_4_9_14_3_um_filter_46_8]|nr:MAG: hypothetical protein CO189_03615 [candidate division Zixibacteria bacterium CG_4_9_14_3_um_filter_46_8]